MANGSDTDIAKKLPELFHGWRHLQQVVNNQVPAALRRANRLLRVPLRVR